MYIKTFSCRFNPLFRILIGFFLGLSFQFSHATQIASMDGGPTKGPNFVWLISEDNSKHFMRLFDSDGVETPHIEAMATQGLLYSHAFSNSPVCSVARSTLITGTMAPRTGIQYHRKTKAAPMPEGLEMFPVYLRREGYYTTNNNKKDYNAEESPEVWDESSVQASWRNRDNPHQPFFHQETFMESHESRLHFKEDFMRSHHTKENPQEVTLFPYFPDTPTFRFTTAFHRDKIREIDDWVGKRLTELSEDGLLEDTFVFYFGDHGGVLPRSKGYLYEVGLHVPLVVRVPENWRHLVPSQIPQTMEGFVSFIDFAPTLLHLAGLAIPDQMDGKAFLGRELSMEEISSRDETYGYADRFDEKYEMLRSVRKGKWKYIRSFQPYYPDGLHNNYRYQLLAFAEWRSLFEQGNLSNETEQFFLGKPAEMLFDLENDPHETQNLAEDPDHFEKLKSLRDLSSQKSEQILDLSFLPESVMVKEAINNPVGFGKENKDRLNKLMNTSHLAVDQSETASQALISALSDSDELVRYWAVTAQTARSQNQKVREIIGEMTEDKSLLVRWRVVEYLGIHAQVDPFPGLIQLINESSDPVEILQVMNSLVFFKDHPIVNYRFDVGDIKPQAVNDEVNRRMAYFLGTWL
ncbi:sulfatase-like hydrolase/transferase [Lunatibacter salilacus]|uniref:sulfatase-like hydrolase/transferase n=1 Tax=Lunatibacter salilacus TaxID=2483804 RepID=UPI00131ADC12|nr:sulfatase-like hydrolase/transferase [Lunatibacter salilacus]